MKVKKKGRKINISLKTCKISAKVYAKQFNNKSKISLKFYVKRNVKRDGNTYKIDIKTS